MKFTINLSRILAGLVFIFSGFVKAIDPMGSAIKFEEYFLAFHTEFLVFLALPLAILLSAFELMIGLNLLARIRMRFTGWLLLLFMTFFLVLTFILALGNPVSDCGCFGDAIKLTNWQTFGKNVIIYIPSLIVFFNRKNYKTVAIPFTEWYLTGVNFIFPVLISVFSLIHQPVIDFRPYKPGVNITESMTLPENAPVDQYKTIFIYERNGEKKEFSENNIPWQDSTWKWVETRQKLISKGAVAPIHDFSVTRMSGGDITDSILNDEGYTFLFISHEIEKAGNKPMLRLNKLASRAKELGYKTFCLTASTTGHIQQFTREFNPEFEICTTDGTTLKTIIRSNPGLIVLRKGTILAKWNYRDAPEPHELDKDFMKTLLRHQTISSETSSVMFIILIAGLFYALFFMAFIRRE